MADATRFIGDLEPGECKVQYWSFTYPACANTGAGDAVEPPCTTTPTWGPSIKPDDDLSLHFDIWATADDITDPAYARWRMTMRNQISAMANKIRPNPDGLWFNTDTSIVAPGSVITTNGVLYTLGNVRFGFDNDGDFVPDFNAWLQPFGDVSYDPSCFRLIRSSTVLTVSRSGGNPALIIETDDQNIHPIYGGPLYFTNLPPNNNGVRGEVRYTFLALGGPCSLPISPYQEVASGFDNEKFNGDFGTGIPTVQSSAPEVIVSKSGPDSVAVNTIYTYSIPFQNTSVESSAGLTLNNGGINMPLSVRDIVPEGLQYVGGSAASGNTNPTGCWSDCYTIRYSTNGGATWSATDPGDRVSTAANPVVIQWWLNDVLPPLGSGEVTFQARVPTDYTGSPFIVNEACLNFGGGANFACDTDVTMIEGNNSIGNFVWRDLNTNGVQDGGAETGIEGVTVWLYWDVNGNGVLDDDALLIAAIETDENGEYVFPDLPDGDYLVVVDSDSPNLPDGYANTTPAIHPVTDLSGGTDYTLADFGFGPVLSLVKRVVEDTGPPAVPPAYEGHPVTYEIELTNNLPGNGTGQPTACTYTVWAGGGQTNQGPNKDFFFPERAWDGNENSFAEGEWVGGTNKWLYGNNFIGLDAFDSNHIIRLEAISRIYIDGPVLTNDFLRLYLTTFAFGDASNNPRQTAPERETTFAAGFLEPNFRGVNNAAYVEWLVWDLAVDGAWGHADINSPAWRLVVEPDKTGGADGTQVFVANLGLRITTNETCGGSVSTIDPLPLTDTYDADKLEFVSASPLQSSVTFTDTPYANTGIISWNNVGPLHAGQTKTVTVTFLGLEPQGNVTTEITNTATVTGATFSNGRAVNNAEDDAVIDLEPTGSISGVVWNDNGLGGGTGSNGVQDGDEAGIAGVTVYLCITSSCNSDSAVATTVTDADGNYTFGGLLDGNYYTAVDTTTLPAGNTQTGDPDVPGANCGASCDNQTTNPVNVSGAADIANIDYGYTVPNTIFGHVWNDHNGDGTLDDVTGIAGVTVRLFDNDTEIATTTTDANGRYIFTGMADGNYRIVIDSGTLPNASDADVNWQQTYDPDNDLDDQHTIPVTIEGGNIFGAYDFAYYKGGDYSISGTVYADWNSNNELDGGEPGFAGITVTLYDEDGNIVAVTTTDENGDYTFGDLPPGTFTVVVNENDLPTQYSQTQDPETPGDTCTNCNGQGTVTIGAADVEDFNFGYEPAGYGIIGDRVWRDNNGDGLQQAGEPGLENITVYLYVDLNGNGDYVRVDETQTGANGIYSFDNLPPGDYRVVVDTEDDDLPLDGYDNPMVTTTPTFFDVALASGQTYLDADFGFAPGGVIGNTIYWDANGNAEQDLNELGIPGVTVELWVWDAEADDWVFYDDAVTDADGEYLFTGLPRGNYQVRVDTDSAPIAGRNLTGDPDTNGIPCTPDPGTPWSAFCDSQHEVEIRPGQVYLGADFGYQPTGVIGDTIWLDSNGDGVQDPDEGPIPFVNVWLCATDSPCDASTAVLTTTTDADGYYSFSNIDAGTWYVAVDVTTLPAGLSPTYDLDSGTTAPDNITQVVLENQGDSNLQADFGYAYIGDFAISGYLFDHPVDGEGNPIARTEGPRAQAGDLTYTDVVVYLWRENDSGGYTRIAETVTGSNGLYEFGNLPPGNYAVSVDANDPALEGTSHATHAGIYTGEGEIPAAENDGMVFEYVVITASNVENIDFGFGGDGNPTAVFLQSLLATTGSQIMLPWLLVMLLLTFTGMAVRRRALRHS